MDSRQILDYFQSQLPSDLFIFDFSRNQFESKPENLTFMFKILINSEPSNLAKDKIYPIASFWKSDNKIVLRAATEYIKNGFFRENKDLSYDSIINSLMKLYEIFTDEGFTYLGELAEFVNLDDFQKNRHKKSKNTGHYLNTRSSDGRYTAMHLDRFQLD